MKKKANLSRQTAFSYSNLNISKNSHIIFISHGNSFIGKLSFRNQAENQSIGVHLNVVSIFFECQMKGGINLDAAVVFETGRRNLMDQTPDPQVLYDPFGYVFFKKMDYTDREGNLRLNQDTKRIVKGPVWSISESEVSAVFSKWFGSVSFPSEPSIPVLSFVAPLCENEKGGGDWYVLLKDSVSFCQWNKVGKFHEAISGFLSLNTRTHQKWPVRTMLNRSYRTG